MPTYDYMWNLGKLIMQSRENDQKPQFGQFFDDFEVKYLQIEKFSEKWVSFKFKVIFSTNFRPKTKKIIRAVFEKNIKVSDFGLIWSLFRGYVLIKIFFKNPTRRLFYLYIPLASCKKQSLFWENRVTIQPTNQPTNYCQQHRFYRTWLTPVQKHLYKI